ncbi:unnamed protein product [Angiostrongylus costaricensis]|uniref:UDENN domain-containing protein n=1 Tax=Angiostrongylus costaricensis TaxID=334426 RepID=A0A158PDH8_ANGCS|nr:unnamed protein product [Angiostrongylus costaricensis]
MSGSEVERQCTPRLADYFVELQLDETQISELLMISFFCVPSGWSLAYKELDPTFFVCTLTDLMGAHQYACCLQTCLHRIFIALQSDVNAAEVMIATIISKILLIGRTPISFTMGGERISVQPILQRRVPLTGDRVTRFFKCLGSIFNFLTVVRAVLCDTKIILHSSSQQRLSDSAYAIKSIIFPFEYTYTFVTALPELLLEYLESPTPYLMGVLSQVREKLPPVDAVVVDLDTGEVRLPENTQLAELPSPFRERLIYRLQRVLNPELATADLALPVALPPPPEPHLLRNVMDSVIKDKEIRSCFIVFFAELLYGYRSCLELVRLHRHPLIVFHKAAFMGMRFVVFCTPTIVLPTYLLIVLMQTFKFPSPSRSHRGTNVVCSATIEDDDLDLLEEKQRLTKISSTLLINEKQERIMTTTPTLSKRASLSFANGDSVMHDCTTGREISDERINNLVEQNRLQWNLDDPDRLCRKIVPVPEKLNLYEEHLGANSRRLLVLSACINAIFDNHISEARKMMCAVELSLRVVTARVTLCRHLANAAVPVTRAMLQPAQFELVVRLLNCALEHESDDDQHGIAYACLHLGNVYCRVGPIAVTSLDHSEYRLTPGVQQYAYTCVQDHSVWSNQRFWEAAFFHDVHELMRRHYGYHHDSIMPLCGKGNHDMWNLLDEPTAMELTAARLCSLSELSNEELAKCSEEEESIVYGQAKHYVNLMTYLRVPLDASRLRRIDRNDLELRGNSWGRPNTESLSESDGESGFIENVNDGDLGTVVVNWISRVIDRICSAAGLDPHLTEKLTQIIPGFVAVHIDNLEQVYVESRKLAPPPKVRNSTLGVKNSKLLTPVLITPCERIMVGGLRCVLLPERQSIVGDNLENNMSLLPAEGALFLTNYRIIFKGRPMNPFLTDEIVVRSVPVMTLTKEKAVNDHSLHSGGLLHGLPSKLASSLHDGLQMRTSCFQLLRVAFDEEVSADDVEAFTKSLSNQRWPNALPHSLFAYNTVSHLLTATLPSVSKNKYSTIRELKKTISRFPGKSGRFSASNSMSRRRLDSIDKWPQAQMIAPAMKALTQPTKNETSVSHISDDSFMKIAKGFKHGRFPVITWTNENGALLIRGSGFAPTNVVQKIKKANILHANESVSTLGGSRMTLVSKDSGESGPLNSVEFQEHYLARLAQVSPSDAGDLCGAMGSMTSLLSIESILTGDGISVATGTPDARRRNQTDFGRYYATSFRSTNTKPYSRGSMMLNPAAWTASTSSSSSERQPLKTLQHAIGSLTRRNLYILVEKAHAKIFRCDKNIEFVPISFPTTHNMKVSFKKLLRAMQPSAPFTDSSTLTFYRSVEESEWLQMVAVCIEEGWDATCQLMSLAELMLDPYYRTIEGFQSSAIIQKLIEKEWLAFGHRFSHRANHTISSQNSGITPVFLLFLDAVHQLLIQFPGAFEINDFYLRFLAYHSQSAFFRTFIMDSESERVQLEQLIPETGEDHRGCIWLYIKEKTGCKTIFHNLLYSSDGQGVLIPACSVAALQIWSFYSEETLSHGSPYDIGSLSPSPLVDVAEAEQSERDEEYFSHSECVTTGGATSRIIDGVVTCQDLKREDGITFLLQTNNRLNPLEKPRVGDWLTIWNAAEERMITDDEEVRNSCKIDYLRSICYIVESLLMEITAIQIQQDDKEEKPRNWDWLLRRVLLKKAALRILLRGVSSRLATSKKNASRNHVFEHYGASGGQPSECALCRFPLYGTVVRTGQRCRQCGVIAHDKCIVNVTWPCSERASTGAHSPLETTLRSTTENMGTVTHSETLRSDGDGITRTLTLNHGTNLSSHNTVPLHKGYLSKKGAKFKLWAPRWFELEANSHKMYYYESEHDLECRGYIDLCDVGSVEVETSGNKAILELRTKERVYSLLAESRQAAETWKEKIEMVLRE